MKRNHRRGNNHADDMFMMPCPDCDRPLMLSAAELVVGHELECSHCQHSLHLCTTTLPGQSGQYWTLLGSEAN